MIATARFYWLLGGLAAFGLIAGLYSAVLPLWAGAFGVVCVAGCADWWALSRQKAPKVSRQMPDALAVGVWTDVVLELGTKASAELELFDCPPPSCDVDGMPAAVELTPKTRTTIAYRIRANERGQHSFEPADVRLRGPLGLFKRQVEAGDERSFRVLPNFKAVSRYALLATADRVGEMGIRKVRRRGSGMEFSHLREYRQGDLSRQIDWKASARRRELISREYEDEKDQHIVFMLDCGRRMRARDGDLSHFDRCLNATLLLSHVALNQGDSVAMSTFGGHKLWVPRQKGPGGIHPILERVYDLKPTTAPSDYSEAARRLVTRQRRRALVVVLTNLYDQLDEELLEAITLLRRRHLVLIASLREAATERVVAQSVDGFDEALDVAAGHAFLREREAIHRELEGRGTLVLDVPPDKLSVQLVNRYIEIKRAGVL